MLAPKHVSNKLCCCKAGYTPKCGPILLGYISFSIFPLYRASACPNFKQVSTRTLAPSTVYETSIATQDVTITEISQAPGSTYYVTKVRDLQAEQLPCGDVPGT